MKMRAVVEIWLKSLIDEFTLGGLHSALDPAHLICLVSHLEQFNKININGYKVRIPWSLKPVKMVKQKPRVRKESRRGLLLTILQKDFVSDSANIF